MKENASIKRRVISICFSIFFLFCIVTSSLFSKEVQNPSPVTNIAISPLIFSNLVANSGDSLSNVIKVYNTSPQTEKITMLSKDFIPSGEKGAVTLVNRNVDSTFSLSNWITIDPQTFSLAPNSFQVVKYTINVPKQAEPGGRYASVVAALESENAVQSSGSSIGTEVGSLIFLTVAGKATVDASLLSFTTQPYTFGNPETFEERVKDEGNVHIKAAGQIVITDIFGHSVSIIKVADTTVLPKAIRAIEEELNVDKFAGYYTATLTLTYNAEDQKNTIIKTTNFWVIPILPIAIVIGLLIILILFRRNIIRAGKAFVGK